MAKSPTNMTNKNAIKKKVFMLPSISERTADLFYWVGNVLILIAAVAGLVGGIGVLWGDRVRDWFADQRIASNEQKTSEANKSAEDARKNAAESKAETDVLNNKVIDGQKQIQDLQFSLSQRILLPETRKQWVADLLKYAGQKFKILPLTSGDIESENVAKSVTSILINANWIEDNTVTGVPAIASSNSQMMMLPSFTSSTVNIYFNPQENQRRPVFIDFLARFPPPPTIAVSNDVAVGTVVVVINPKLPPDYAARVLSKPDQRFDNLLKLMHFDQRIMEFTRKFVGQSFVIISPKNDPDADYAAQKLSEILRQNGWKQIGTISYADYALNFGPMMIGINPADKTTTSAGRAAEGFLDLMKNVGTLDKTLVLKDMPDTARGVMVIKMGLIPYLGKSPLSP